MNLINRLLICALMSVSVAAGATVRMTPDGITADTTRQAVRRGAETLHPVRVNRAWVEQSAGRGSLWLPTTGAAPVLARYIRSMRSADGNWTWVGRVDTRIGEQSAILTFGDRAVFGLIPQPNGLPLRVETRNGRIWLVEGALPPKRLPQGHSDGLPPPSATTKSSGQAPTLLTGQSTGGTVHAAAGSPVTIDVLVVYTPSVVTYYGTDSAARTHLDFLASVANQAYADTGVNQQIRIVSKQLLNYTTANDNGPLLDLITNPSADPVKTQVDSWRSQFGADLVSVVRAFDNSTQTNCGLAWIGGYHTGNFSDTTHGFSVVGDGANGGFYCADQTFAHELGHNMGCGHDFTTDSGDFGAFSYSRGYRQTIDSNTGFATVMAYSEDPQVILTLFSNPNSNSCMGQPCGVPDSDPQAADNAHTLGNSGSPISSYVATVVPLLPALSVSDVSVSEGDAGTKVATFTVTLSATSGSAVTYNIATSNDTATAGSDYVASSLVGQSIAAGQTSKTFSVTINGDAAVESNETFFVTLSNPSGATVADGYATGTIINDDGPTLSIGDVSISEGNSGTKTAVFTVQLSAASGSSVTYNITTANGSATAGSDFVASTLSGQTITAGQTSKTFSVTINGDTAVETNETFTVTATSVSGATVVDPVGFGTIINDDGPTLSIGDVSISEGNSGTKTANFTVTLSATSVTPVSYNISTANGTATAGSDYVAKTANNEVISAGQTSRAFSVTINGDTTTEPNETFLVNITAATGASIADSQATGTITNDDNGPVPSLSIGDVSISEGNSGTKVATFTVTLSATSASTVTYDIATADGTANAGSDYVANSLNGQSIAAGLTSKTFAVTINGDTAVESDETFAVYLSNANNATIADDHAIGTISNDDVVPTLSIGDAAISEGNSGTKTLVFTVHLSQAASTGVTYNIATANGTATAGSDYVANSLSGQLIPAGNLSKNFSVTLNGDTTIEPNETFTVTLSNPSGATISDAQATGTISNDDVPSLSISDTAINEGNSGTKTMVFTVHLSQAATTGVNYNIATANGTATAGSDYVANSLNAQLIPAGSVSKLFSVTINGDATIEPNETLTANLSAASGATISDAQATGTINNDDVPSLSISDAAINEGNSGTKTLVFTVHLSQAASTNVKYDIATANGTATAGSDYVANSLSGQLIPTGSVSKLFSVTLNGDVSVEPNETFTVTLTNPSGATISDAQATGTINNDD